MFTNVIVLVTVFVSVAARTTWRDLDNYTFDQYVQEFKYNFKPQEIEERRSIFLKELQRIKAHNARDSTWKAGVNKFTVMTQAERNSFYGRSKAVAANSNLKHQKDIPEDFPRKELQDLPASVDWRDKGVVSPVKDQGHCGSCWAFASTETIESHVAIASGLLYDLSPEQIAMCAPNPDKCGGVGGCEGSTAELAFEYLTTSDGHFEEFQYPYLSYDGTDYNCSTTEISKITAPKGMIGGYVKLPNNNYKAVMNAIAEIGPMAVNVDASVWHLYESGIFDGCDQESPDINHVVQLVGYGEENGQAYWLVRNSWSPSYGEAGYIRLARKDVEEKVCGIDSTPQDGVECEGGPTEVTVCGTCGVIYDVSYPIMAASLA